MKKSFMTRVLATGLSLAMAFSLSAATNVSVASAAAKPAMKSSKMTVKVGQSKNYQATTATQKAYKITKIKMSAAGKTKAEVKINSSKKSIKVTGLAATKGSNVVISFKNNTTKKTTTVTTKVVVTEAEKPEAALALAEVKQVASNQIKVTFNKDASANGKDAYKIAAKDGTKEIGVKAVTYSEDGKSALIDTYANVDNGVAYTVTAGELTGSFTASVGEVASISISTANAQQNVKTPIKFTLFDANGIDVTPSVSVDSTCVITLDGSYVTAEKDKASNASVTMGTVGSTVDVTVTYNKGVANAETITAKQTITCVAVGQTLGNAVFVDSSNINNKSECAKFYLGLSDKIVAVAENKSKTNIFFCAKDNNGDVISYDKYDVESSNDDVATVTVTKDSGKYMQLTVNGNSVGSANLNVSASKNGVVTAYSIPVTVSKGTTAVKMVATATKPVMSNVKDNEYEGKIEAKLLDANGKEVPGYFTYSLSKVVADDKAKIVVNESATGNSTTVKAVGATPGTYAVKVTGSENIDMSYAFEQNVQIQVKALPAAAYATTGGIKVTYQVELSNTDVDENPTFTGDKAKDTTKARLYAVYNGLFAGYVNDDGSVSDEDEHDYSLNSTAKGIRVITDSAIFDPYVAVKFGNQYYESDTNVVELYTENHAPKTMTITTTAGVIAQLEQVETDAVDVTIESVDHDTTVKCGDAASNGAVLWTDLGKIGTYTVEYYYHNVKGDFVKTPITKSFSVKNTLVAPTVKVLSKKVASFDEAKLISVMKASVDMNNNVSDHESIVDLNNGTDEANATEGVLSSDGLKTTYKYAVVEDNFGTNETWQFYVPINTTFSYQ